MAYYHFRARLEIRAMFHYPIYCLEINNLTINSNNLFSLKQLVKYQLDHGSLCQTFGYCNIKKEIFL